MALYERPAFHDRHGHHDAVDFLTSWRMDPKSPSRWLVIVGEYGTGKTALTRVLHQNWLHQYVRNPSFPIPFRIELRDFTRQFDDRTLLHHFLDTNGLSALPIEFVYHLLRAGRLLLILDGYDEMAQYMHTRERRACLEALAALSAGGAKGILTSRPNYFSEAEELQLFEVLYRSLEREGLHIGGDTLRALENASFARSQLTVIDFTAAKLSEVAFDQATIDAVDFSGASLDRVTFRNAFFMDANFSGTEVRGADFVGVGPGDVSIVVDGERYAGYRALGYLSYNGAIVDNIPNAHTYRHHPKYEIVEKILEKLSEQSVRQERGLTQRGEARNDPVFARAFLDYLKHRSFIEQRREDQVAPTAAGRAVVARFLQTDEVPAEIAEFLDRNQ